MVARFGILRRNVQIANSVNVSIRRNVLSFFFLVVGSNIWSVARTQTKEVHPPAAPVSSHPIRDNTHGETLHKSKCATKSRPTRSMAKQIARLRTNRFFFQKKNKKENQIRNLRNDEASALWSIIGRKSHLLHDIHNKWSRPFIHHFGPFKALSHYWHLKFF